MQGVTRGRRVSGGRGRPGEQGCRVSPGEEGYQGGKVGRGRGLHTNMWLNYVSIKALIEHQPYIVYCKPGMVSDPQRIHVTHSPHSLGVNR